MAADTTEEKVYPLAGPIRKTCELYRLLAGYEVTGLAPAEIAKALDVPPSWVSVNLSGLASVGFVERVGDTRRWRLGVAFVRIAATVFSANTSARKDLDERLARITTPL